MIKVYKEISIDEFKPWSGAVDTLDKIREADKIEEFDSYLEEEYPDGIDETELNDLLWFEDKFIFDLLGINEEEDEDDDWEDFEDEEEVE